MSPGRIGLLVGSILIFAIAGDPLSFSGSSGGVGVLGDLESLDVMSVSSIPGFRVTYSRVTVMIAGLRRQFHFSGSSSFIPAPRCDTVGSEERDADETSRL